MKQEEREALSAYRTALDAKTHDPQPAWGRLVSKIEAGAHPLSVDLVTPRRPWWIAGALGVAAAAGLALWLVPSFQRSQSEAVTSSPQAAMEADVEPEVVAPPVAPSEPPTRVVTPPPAPEEPEPEPEPTPKPSRKPAPTYDVVAEANAIRQVQTAVRDGRAKPALQLLRRYRARFPKGALRDEAALLQADALCLDGKRDAARRAADAFVRAHPSSPLAQRAKGICAD